MSLMTTVLPIVGAVLVAALTYWFSKRKERDAELRKEKLEHYKALTLSLSGILDRESTLGGRRNFSIACDNLLLLAPQQVLEALRNYQDETSTRNLTGSPQRHDQLLSELFREIRRDLNVTPSDSESFHARLWAAGTEAEKARETLA